MFHVKVLVVVCLSANKVTEENARKVTVTCIQFLLMPVTLRSLEFSKISLFTGVRFPQKYREYSGEEINRYRKTIFYCILEKGLE